MPTQGTDIVPAAQYLRMSTEHQQYSLANQSEAIEHYAKNHHFRIVRTYSDAAKSGILLKHREGLKELLQDVMTTDCSFGAILVYDISRWGRFQDSDEAAHYEFLCKSAGVPVHYCAEAFENVDPRFVSLLKNLKRTMAGEYSRELSTKVYEGQKRVARLGFKCGGLPGYGLRRMMVNADGEHKREMGDGERKSLPTDRVILIPGPEEEVRHVRSIFRWFIQDRWPVSAIVDELNRLRIPYIGGREWRYWAIYYILHHAKYAGFNVYGRTSAKLSGPTRHLPRERWLRVPAFQPIIDQQTFIEAQRILDDRPSNKSDGDLIASLKTLYAKHGKLSMALITNDPDTPNYWAYRERFGGLKKAYELAGYSGKNRFIRTDRRLAIQKLRRQLMEDLVSQNPGAIKIIDRRPRRSWLRLKDHTVVCVLACRSIARGHSERRWVIDAPKDERRRITLLALLDGSNIRFEHLVLVPDTRTKSRKFRVTLGSELISNGKKVAALDHFLEIARALHAADGNR